MLRWLQGIWRAVTLKTESRDRMYVEALRISGLEHSIAVVLPPFPTDDPRWSKLRTELENYRGAHAEFHRLVTSAEIRDYVDSPVAQRYAAAQFTIKSRALDIMAAAFRDQMCQFAARLVFEESQLEKNNVLVSEWRSIARYRILCDAVVKSATACVEAFELVDFEMERDLGDAGSEQSRGRQVGVGFARRVKEISELTLSGGTQQFSKVFIAECQKWDRSAYISGQSHDV